MGDTGILSPKLVSGHSSVSKKAFMDNVVLSSRLPLSLLSTAKQPAELFQAACKIVLASATSATHAP